MIKKLERDGKVGIIVSYGYGAGWSTWNLRETAEEMLFDADMIRALENGASEAYLKSLAKKKWPDATILGIEDGLSIEWVEKGKPFRIEEYDGKESVVLYDPDDYYVA